MADKEYIERTALIAEYDRVHVGEPGGARKLMVEAPTEDVVEVRRGNWIEYGASYTVVGGIPAKCSVCGTNGLRYKYCTNCGAKMDGKGDGE